MPSHNELRVYANRATMGFAFLLSMAFVLLPVALHVFTRSGDDPSVDPALYGLAAITTLFFGPIAVLFLVILLRRRPILVLNEDGIRLRTFDKVSVAWAEVAGMGEVRVGKNSFLVIELNDPDEVLSRMWLPNRILARLNAAYVGAAPALMVSTLLLGTRPDDIIREARKHLPHHLLQGAAP